MRYDLLVPPRTCFGWGRLEEAGALALSLGDTAYLVGGADSAARNGVLRVLEDALHHAGVEIVHLGGTNGEPSVEGVDRLAEAIRADLARRFPRGAIVVGVGGGSALDLAKATSALATNPHIETVRDALEGVGRGLRIEHAPLPMLAIPTTAGTGSECTRNAVISSNPGETPGFKKSLRADSMVPRIALVDPEVTVSLPADLTARTGMDAITQLIEARLSCRARPIPSALAAEGLAQALPGIERAVADPTDQAARCAMSHAAYLSGIALANSGLGVAHGVAAALGIVAGVPHGLACAVLLPVALEANRQVRTREVAEFGRLLRAQPFACDAEAAEWAPAGVRELNARLGIPATLGALGVRAEQLPELVRQSHGNSLSGNPRPIPDDELGAILEALL